MRTAAVFSALATRQAPRFAAVTTTAMRWCQGQGRVWAFDDLAPTMKQTVQRVHSAPTDPMAWQDLGVMMEGHDRVEGPGGPVSRLDCLRTAADLAWDNSVVWMHVGASLEEGEVLEVRDTAMTPLGCLLRSVRLDPSNGTAWLNLAFALRPEQCITLPDVGKIGRLEILSLGAAALERELAAAVNPAAAEDTASMLSGCYAMGAGAMMAGHAANVPEGLPRERSFTFPAGGPEQRTALQCVERALQVDPGAAMPWSMAGNLMRSGDTVKLKDGSTATRSDVLQHLLSNDPENADALAGMAEDLTADGTVTVAGQTMTKIELLGRALSHDVASVAAWRELGKHCAATGAELPLADGSKLSAVECYGRALVYDTSDPAVWESAALVMEQTNTATVPVGSLRLTAAECRQMAAAQRGEADVPAVFATQQPRGA
jgi:hypothetical protein